MKSKNIQMMTFIFSLVLGFHGYVKAQNDDLSDFFQGIQNTLTDVFANTFSDNPRVSEFVRLMMLQNNDISLMMMSTKKGVEIDKRFYVAPNFGFYMKQKALENDQMYIEFDWDNKAQIMIGSSGSKDNEYGIVINGEEIGGTKNTKGQPVVQFTDKDGYWYTPIEVSPGKYGFVKFNAKNMAAFALGELYENALNINTEYIFSELMQLYETIDLGMLEGSIGGGYIFMLANLLAQYENSTKPELEAAIKSALEALKQDIEGFPIFIHWAFLYSPELIRSSFNVSEKKFDCYGIDDGCTELKVKSGNEKGKSMVFDPYNRLLFIDAKKDGKALFNYDRDLTVNLPPAAKLMDVMTGKVKIGN